MKKIISSILCLIIILALISCGNDQTAGRKNNQQAGVNDILEAGMSEAEKTTDSADAETKENTGAKESRQSGLNDNAPFVTGVPHKRKRRICVLKTTD